MQVEPIVEIENLVYSYPDGQQALRGISLEVDAGERVALVGTNGAGKSTLLLHLNGILRGKGSVRIGGRQLDDGNLRSIRASVGLVFQDPDDQLFSPTVFDDVAFGPLYMGLSDDDVRSRAHWALEQVQMGSYASRMPHRLSLGEKKKVSIATVLAMEPQILALDEPSAGLDPRARIALLDLLLRLPQTMVIASHDLDLVRQMCDRAVILEDGRLVAELGAGELLEEGRLEALLAVDGAGEPDHATDLAPALRVSIKGRA